MTDKTDSDDNGVKITIGGKEKEIKRGSSDIPRARRGVSYYRPLRVMIQNLQPGDQSLDIHFDTRQECRNTQSVATGMSCRVKKTSTKSHRGGRLPWPLAVTTRWVHDGPSRKGPGLLRIWVIDRQAAP